MCVICRDWRLSQPSEIAALLDRETARWRDDLGWDVRSSWRVIEPARAGGALPGFVAQDGAGNILGWTWFLRVRDCLQVGALVAERDDTVHALVRAIMTSDDWRASRSSVWSIRGTPPGLALALDAEDLAVARYLYQSAGLTRSVSEQSRGRAFTTRDRGSVTDLFARAYAGSNQVRAFAPGGSPREWRDYVGSLIDTDGCGTWLPEASFVADDGDGALTGAVVTTRIAADVAHIPQIVVDPAAQGRGLGMNLLRGSMAACASRGCRRMTLLVEDGNTRARAMYARAGFETVSEFVVAASQPRRLTSVALASGGVSTRR